MKVLVLLFRRVLELKLPLFSGVRKSSDIPLGAGQAGRGHGTGSLLHFAMHGSSKFSNFQRFIQMVLIFTLNCCLGRL